MVIYQFSLQVRIPYICSLDCNLVKHNFHTNKKTPVSYIFLGWQKKNIYIYAKKTQHNYAEPFGQMCSAWKSNCFCFSAWDVLIFRVNTICHSRPRWLSWMRRPTGDQEVAGSTPAEVGNILSWRLIMKYFLRSFSPFRWFKKGSCQFLAKECAQYWLTA